jgi:3-dehydroquinate dehydratase-1
MSAKIKIKNLELGTVPRVVGIIDHMMSMQSIIQFARQGVDIFELRVDLFSEPADKVVEYVKWLGERVSQPLIGTVRENDANRADRAERLASLARYVDCIDIELGMPEWRAVVDSAPESTLVMVSEHDFNGTPDLAGLDDIVKRSLSQGADIVKIAAMASCQEDVTRLLRFTEECGAPLVTMAMGDIGTVSRVVAPLFGSLFVYGYLFKPLVPGQLSAPKIIRALSEYFPSRSCAHPMNFQGAPE